MRSCPLHSVNKDFQMGLKELKNIINLDQFALDTYFFFKYLSAHREDCKGFTEIADVAAQ